MKNGGKVDEGEVRQKNRSVRERADPSDDRVGSVENVLGSLI